MEGDETRATEGARKRLAPHIIWQYIDSLNLSEEWPILKCRCANCVDYREQKFLQLDGRLQLQLQLQFAGVCVF